jgi:cytochrome c-type biogenesis protein CcmH/NrfF
LLRVLVAAALAGAAGGRVVAETPKTPGDRALMIEIEEALVCQCGCGLTVHACNHLNCPSGIPMKEEIAARLARGETKDQILGHFESRYGEKVLSAPTFSGFNLVAWVAPAVFVVLGAAGVALLTRRWARETAEEAAAALPPAGMMPPDDPVRARLAREIRDFDG